MLQSNIKARYMAALDSFIDKIKDDINIIAVIVSGSLAYDVIWEKSDIDMTIIVRDQTLKHDSYAIIEDGITINAHLIQRSIFKRELERNYGGSFTQSYYSKGKMIYSTDESLSEYFEDLKKVGKDDMAISVLYLANQLVSLKEKCQKWLYVRKDPLYAQYYLLLVADTIAKMEICLNGLPISRETIQKAIEINPHMIKPFYHDAMSHHLSEEEINNRILDIECYLEKHLDFFKKPVIDFMSDQEIKTTTMISNYFHVESHFIIGIFEYLADKGVIEKVSQTIRLTPKSKLSVEEIGYIYIAD